MSPRHVFHFSKTIIIISWILQEKSKNQVLTFFTFLHFFRQFKLFLACMYIIWVDSKDILHFRDIVLKTHRVKTHHFSVYTSSKTWLTQGQYLLINVINICKIRSQSMWPVNRTMLFQVQNHDIIDDVLIVLRYDHTSTYRFISVSHGIRYMNI